MTETDSKTLSRDDMSLSAAFLIALTATLGALFIGEVLGQMPCTLCWYQRIAMFPLVLIFGLSLWRGDGMAKAYGLPLRWQVWLSPPGIPAFMQGFCPRQSSRAPKMARPAPAMLR